MSWLQLRIVSSREQVPAIEQALDAAGALSITFEDNADQPIFEPELGETPLWQDTRITGLFPADVDSNVISDTLARSLTLPLDALHWHVLEDKDWEREWMSQYHPIQCGERFWICPSWTPPPDPNAVNLMLDPGLAFGTGTHPTTFLCLQWLSEQPVEGCEVIDYGCGSGILGIGALLLGASRVQGVDIDPQALVATRDNTARNGLDADRFPVYFPKGLPAQHADIVLANILAGPLVELAPTLSELAGPGARLCLSGVLATQSEAILEAYSATFDMDSPRQKDEWICLTGRRKSTEPRG